MGFQFRPPTRSACWLRCTAQQERLGQVNWGQQLSCLSSAEPRVFPLIREPSSPTIGTGTTIAVACRSPMPPPLLFPPRETTAFDVCQLGAGFSILTFIRNDLGLIDRILIHLSSHVLSPPARRSENTMSVALKAGLILDVVLPRGSLS